MFYDGFRRCLTERFLGFNFFFGSALSGLWRRRVLLGPLGSARSGAWRSQFWEPRGQPPAALNNTNMTGLLPTHTVANAYQIIVTTDLETDEMNDENIPAGEVALPPGITTNTEYSPIANYATTSILAPLLEPEPFEVLYYDLQFTEKDTVPHITFSGPEEMTIGETVDWIGFGRFQNYLKLLCGLIYMSDGIELMILGYLSAPLRCEWQVSNTRLALLSTVVFVGQALGASMWGWVSDHSGRKVAWALGSSFLLVSGLLSAVAPDYWTLVACRFGVGLGVGTVPLATMFYSEFLPSKRRGQELSMLNLLWAAGVVILAVSAMFVIPALGWRTLLLMAAAPAIVPVCAVWFLPESPMFLVAEGRDDQALEVIQRIAKTNGVELSPGYRLRKEKLSCEEKNITQIFTDPDMTYAVVTLFPMWVALGFCYFGIVLLTTEVPQATLRGLRCTAAQGSILSLAGWTTFNKEASLLSIQQRTGVGLSFLQRAFVLGNAFNAKKGCPFDLRPWDYFVSAVSALGELPGVIVPMFLMDVIGRRLCLATSFFVYVPSVLLLLGCFGDTAEMAFFLVARISIFAAFQVMYIYTTELFPTAVRARVLGMLVAVSRVGCMLTPFAAQLLLYHNARLTFVIYASLAFIACICALVLRTETMGKQMVSRSPSQASLKSQQSEGSEVADGEYDAARGDSAAASGVQSGAMPSRRLSQRGSVGSPPLRPSSPTLSPADPLFAPLTRAMSPKQQQQQDRKPQTGD
uniref:Major facilitator superfamily (MFS) profile domain-containing protein n=1 Tax=Chromera velia CCMP2878 TaxID=1169474 RepID=A0A0G4GJS8_9ALVE|eukprot:Cvel_4809.t1-p1 / transcript=Cvel_4809.t1 / gene=Cvel_4809 / organism=Chromera_velia_CCMP2878 / gene_product=Synaptic vesicle 2-related protein, putative / transcript_product=Synaptic vesicle 2-related protein, putative / location=Cvel_scaffold215:71168-86428(-) / protein_length=748 / sequence_SO=supercontig / SO=protein_coding / is_pseudo=false